MLVVELILTFIGTNDFYIIYVRSIVWIITDVFNVFKYTLQVDSYSVNINDTETGGKGH